MGRGPWPRQSWRGPARPRRSGTEEGGGYDSDPVTGPIGARSGGHDRGIQEAIAQSGAKPSLVPQIPVAGGRGELDLVCIAILSVMPIACRLRHHSPGLCATIRPTRTASASPSGPPRGPATRPGPPGGARAPARMAGTHIRVAPRDRPASHPCMTTTTGSDGGSGRGHPYPGAGRRGSRTHARRRSPPLVDGAGRVRRVC